MTACGRVGFDARADATDANAICTHPMLVDDFSDGVAASAWAPFADPGVMVTETGGQLVITLASNAAGTHYGGYTEITTDDLRDRCAFVTVAQTPSADPLVEMTFNVIQSGSLYVGFTIRQGTITAFIRSGTTLTELATQPYSQPILRFREASGVLYWEMAFDAATGFAPLFSEPTPFDFSAVTMSLVAGTFGTAAAPGEGRFDNFDL